MQPEHVPSDLELVSYAAMSKLRLYQDTFGLIGRTMRSIAHLIGNARNPSMHHGAIPLTAPRTPFNAELTPHRRTATATVPLSRVKALKNAYDVKLNDVVLALCASTLRRYLEDRRNGVERLHFRTIDWRDGKLVTTDG